MALQKDLANIQRYNAAIELPHAGLIGLGAFMAGVHTRDRSLATSPLGDCIMLCQMAELALMRDPSEARAHVYFYSARQQITNTEEQRIELREKIRKIRTGVAMRDAV
jgi:hypothetical protein